LLAVTIYEDAAVIAHVLRIPATEVRVEERVPKAITADIEPYAALLRLLVLVHGRHLAPQLGVPCIHFGESLGALLGDVREPLIACCSAAFSSTTWAFISTPSSPSPAGAASCAASQLAFPPWSTSVPNDGRFKKSVRIKEMENSGRLGGKGG
jgi:hypothetical protein